MKVDEVKFRVKLSQRRINDELKKLRSYMPPGVGINLEVVYAPKNISEKHEIEKIEIGVTL